MSRKILRGFIMLMVLSVFTIISVDIIYFRGGSIDVITSSSDYIYESGIQLKDDDMLVENMVFVDIPIGVVIWSDNNIISNCSFINCSDEGLLMLGENNSVVNCLFYLCCDGVEFQSSSGNVFINCRFIECYHMGVDGLGVDNFGNVFTGCVFVDSGIWFRSMNDNRFIDCWEM